MEMPNKNQRKTSKESRASMKEKDKFFNLLTSNNFRKSGTDSMSNESKKNSLKWELSSLSYNKKVADKTKLALEAMMKLARFNLAHKHNANKNSYDLVLMDNLLMNKNCHLVSVFKDHMIHDCSEEFMKKFYHYKDSMERLPKVANYYKNYLTFFCKPCFSNFELNSIIQNYGDMKAEHYYKINYGTIKKKKKQNENGMTDLKTIFNSTVKNNIDKQSILSNLITEQDYTTNNNYINNVNPTLRKKPQVKNRIPSVPIIQGIPVFSNIPVNSDRSVCSINFNMNNKSLQMIKSGLLSTNEDNSIADIVHTIENDDINGDNFSNFLFKTLPNNKYNDGQSNLVSEERCITEANQKLVINRTNNKLFKLSPEILSRNKHNPKPSLNFLYHTNYSSNNNNNFNKPKNTGGNAYYNSHTSKKMPLKATNLLTKNDFSKIIKHKPTLSESKNLKLPFNIHQTIDVNNLKNINFNKNPMSPVNLKETPPNKFSSGEIKTDSRMKITVDVNVNSIYNKQSRNLKTSFNPNGNNMILSPLYATTGNPLATLSGALLQNATHLNVNKLNININNNINLHPNFSSEVVLKNLKKKVTSQNENKLISSNNLGSSNDNVLKGGNLKSFLNANAGKKSNFSTISSLKYNSNNNNNLMVHPNDTPRRIPSQYPSDQKLNALKLNTIETPFAAKTTSSNMYSAVNTEPSSSNNVLKLSSKSVFKYGKKNLVGLSFKKISGKNVLIKNK